VIRSRKEKTAADQDRREKRDKKEKAKGHCDTKDGARSIAGGQKAKICDATGRQGNDNGDEKEEAPTVGSERNVDGSSSKKKVQRVRRRMF
jgi:hypothetical protein